MASISRRMNGGTRDSIDRFKSTSEPRRWNSALEPRRWNLGFKLLWLILSLLFLGMAMPTIIIG